MGFLVLVVPRMTSHILHVIHINKQERPLCYFHYLRKSEIDKKMLTKKILKILKATQ